MAVGGAAVAGTAVRDTVADGITVDGTGGGALVDDEVLPDGAVAYDSELPSGGPGAKGGACE